MSEGSDTGSLLRLFTHPDFDSFLMLQYLHRFYERPGIQEFLVNQMFVRLSDKETELYIPQILALLCHRQPFSLSLERFVLDRCRRSMHLALKFYWYVISYVEDENPVNADFCKALKEACEMALVNGDAGAAASADAILSESKVRTARAARQRRLKHLA